MIKPTCLPGITQRPAWPAPSRPAPPPSSTPPLTLRLQILDTPNAHREAQRLTGQLPLIEEEQ